MRRSKLEMYVDILKVLVHWGPLKMTHVIYKANVNCSVLEEYLDFLIRQGLVEEKIIKKKQKILRDYATRRYSAQAVRRTQRSASYSRRNRKQSEKPKTLSVLKLNFFSTFITFNRLSAQTNFAFTDVLRVSHTLNADYYYECLRRHFNLVDMKFHRHDHKREYLEYRYP